MLGSHHHDRRITWMVASLCLESDFVGSDFNQMLVGVVEIESGSDPARTRLLSGRGVETNRIERRAKCDSASFHPRKYVLELALRHAERIVLKTRRAPWCQLQLTVRPHLEDGEWAVDTFQDETHHLGVERDTGFEIVDLEDDVIERRH